MSPQFLVVRAYMTEASQQPLRLLRKLKRLAPTRDRARRGLLTLESCISVPCFIASWFLCSIYFAAIAGFRMAKADDPQKSALLKKVLGPSKT